MWVLYRCLGTWWKMREKKGRGGCKNRCQVLNISPSLCSSLFIPPKTRVKFDFSPWLSPLHEYSFSVSALWCPLATLTILLGFLLPWCGVSLHGCSSNAQPLLLTLDEGYLLTATVPDLQCGIAPLGGEAWQNVVHWRREWQATKVFLPWEPHEQYEKAKWLDTERGH